jgi:hypothetical protein
VDDENEGRIAFCHGDACEMSHCAGDIKTQCRAGLAMRTDCTLSRQICVMSAGAPTCVFDIPCSHEHCAGDVVTLCTEGRVDIAASCAAILPGSRCSSDRGSVQCMASTPDPSCAGAVTDQWCEGDTAWSCMSGVRIEMDCGALPGGMCIEEPIGDGSVRVRCASASGAIE